MKDMNESEDCEMTDEQFYYLMVALGFGFGSLFWSFVLFLVFGWSGRS